jgi:hypothetical protein
MVFCVIVAEVDTVRQFATTKSARNLLRDCSRASNAAFGLRSELKAH